MLFSESGRRYKKNSKAPWGLVEYPRGMLSSRVPTWHAQRPVFHPLHCIKTRHGSACLQSSTGGGDKRSEGQSHLQLHCEFKSHLGCTR